jgi:hypothetical protein
MVPNTMENIMFSNSGLHWDDGHNPYSQLATILTEDVAGYAHSYAYGSAKYHFLSELTHRPSLNLEHFNFHEPATWNPNSPVVFRRKFPSVHCAIRTAHCFDKRLMYHFQPRKMWNAPKDLTRHTSRFISAL